MVHLLSKIGSCTSPSLRVWKSQSFLFREMFKGSPFLKDKMQIPYMALQSFLSLASYQMFNLSVPGSTVFPQLSPCQVTHRYKYWLRLIHSSYSSIHMLKFFSSSKMLPPNHLLRKLFLFPQILLFPPAREEPSLIHQCIPSTSTNMEQIWVNIS